MSVAELPWTLTPPAMRVHEPCGTLMHPHASGHEHHGRYGRSLECLPPDPP